MARNNKYTSLNFNEIYEKKVVNYNNNNSSPSTTKSPFSTSSASYLSTANKSYSSSAASRLTHGGMLVLSRPSPKPQPQPLQTPPLSPSPKQPPSLTPSSSTHSPTAADSDVISLRPQGKTTVGGTNLTPLHQSPSSPVSMMESDVGSGSLPKSDKFVPPHLRPGYVSKEVAKSPPSHGPEFAHRPRSGNHRPGSGHGYQYHGSPDNHRHGSGHGYQHHGSPNKYVDNGRVKYGGGGGGYQYQGSPDNYRPGSAHGFKENGRVNYGGGYGGGGTDPGYLNRPRSGGSRPNSSG